MEIDIISCQPDLLTSFFSFSIIKRAISSNKVKINVHDLRDYSNDKHKKIDDYQYGGKAGLVMTVESIDECISEIKKKQGRGKSR